MLPLASGGWAAAGWEAEGGQGRIYFPTEVQGLSAANSHQQAALRAAEHSQLDLGQLGIQLLHADFLTALDTDSRQVLVALLKALGVREISVSDIVHSHILPALQAESALRLPHATLVSFAGFILASGVLGDLGSCSAPHISSSNIGGGRANSSRSGGWGGGMRQAAAAGPWGPAGGLAGGMTGFGAGAGPWAGAGAPGSARLLAALEECLVVVVQMEGEEAAVRLRDAGCLHFPLSLGNKVDLQAAFPQHSWAVLSDLYSRNRGGRTAAWRAFFARLGVSDFVQVYRSRRELGPAELAEEGWGSEALLQQQQQSQHLRSTGIMGSDDHAMKEERGATVGSCLQAGEQQHGQQEGEGSDASGATPAEAGGAIAGRQWVVEDWESAEFEQVVEAIKAKGPPEAATAALSQVAGLLDRLWDADYSQATTALVSLKEGASHTSGGAEPVDSTFSRQLRSLAWIPSTHGSIAPPSELYLHSRAITQLLGEHVPYPAVKFSNPRLSSHLGFKQDLDVDAVLGALIGWACEGNPSAEAPGFTSSVWQMTRIYDYLSREMEGGEDVTLRVCQAFLDYSLIWLPDKPAAIKFSQVGSAGAQAKPDHAAKVLGRFYHPVADPLRFFDATRTAELVPEAICPLRILAKFYGGEALTYFFLEQLTAPMDAISAYQAQPSPAGPRGKGNPTTSPATSPGKQKQQKQAKKAGKAGAPTGAATALGSVAGALRAAAGVAKAAAGAAKGAAGAAKGAAGAAKEAAQAGGKLGSMQQGVRVGLLLREPSVAEHADLAQALATGVGESASAADGIRMVVTVLEHLSEQISRQLMSLPDMNLLAQRLQSAKVFPSHKGGLASAAEGLLINDDPEVAKQFEDHPQLQFLAVSALTPPNAQYRHSAPAWHNLAPLLALLQVPLLSLACTREVITYGSHFGTKLEQIVRRCIPQLQHYLYHTDRARYDRVAEGVAATLPQFRVAVVDELFAIFTVRTAQRALELPRSVCSAVMEGPHLYVLFEAVDQYPEIFLELSRMVNGGQPDQRMADFLSGLALTLVVGQDVDGFMERRGFPPLPEDLPRWTLPGGDQLISSIDATAHLMGFSSDSEGEEEAAATRRGRGRGGRKQGEGAKLAGKAQVWPPPCPTSAPAPGEEPAPEHDNWIPPAPHGMPRSGPSLSSAPAGVGGPSRGETVSAAAGMDASDPWPALPSRPPPSHAHPPDRPHASSPVLSSQEGGSASAIAGHPAPTPGQGDGGARPAGERSCQGTAGTAGHGGPYRPALHSSCAPSVSLEPGPSVAASDELLWRHSGQPAGIAGTAAAAAPSPETAAATGVHQQLQQAQQAAHICVTEGELEQAFLAGLPPTLALLYESGGTNTTVAQPSAATAPASSLLALTALPAAVEGECAMPQPLPIRWPPSAGESPGPLGFHSRPLQQLPPPYAEGPWRHAARPGVPWPTPAGAGGGSGGLPQHLPGSLPEDAVHALEEVPVPERLVSQLQSTQLLSTCSPASPEYRLAVGRWGEELVWRSIEAERAASPALAGWEVIWLNQHQEQWQPFDILMRSSGGAPTVFVEVKTSSAPQKDFFEISRAELAFAEAQGDSYHVYRVGGAGGAQPTVMRIINPVQKWLAGAVSVCLVA